MTRPETERVGDAWVYTWPEHGYRVTLDKIHANGDGMHADLLVETAVELATTGKRGHIHWSRLNLGSPIGRKNVVKLLEERTRKAPPLWGDLIEYAVVETREGYEAGEPVVDLATTPARLTVPFLVDRFMPEKETTILMADGESGKSFIAIAVSIAVRTGKPVGGVFRPTRAGPVLYVDYETGQDEVRRRLELLSRGLGIEPPHLHYLALTRGISEEIGRLRRHVDQLGVTLVVLDSLGPATADDLVAGAPAVRTMNALRALRATRLVLAHVSRQNAQNQSGRGYTYGSVFYENLARSVWELRKDEDGGTNALGLFHRKSNLGARQDPIGVRLDFDDEGKRVTVLTARVEEQPQLSQYAPLRFRVMTALRHGGLTVKALSETLSVPESTVRSCLGGMPECMQLEDGGPGRKGAPALWGLRNHT